MKAASFLFLSLIVLLLACHSKKQVVDILPEKEEQKESFDIIGKTSNFAAGTPAYLIYLLGESEPFYLDTAIIQFDGSFQMSGSLASEGIGRITIGRSNILTVLSNDDYQVEIDNRYSTNNKVIGNPLAEQTSDLLSKIHESKATDEYLQTVADTSSNLYFAYLAVSNLKTGLLEGYEKLYERFQIALPDAPITQSIEKDIKREAFKVKASRVTAIGNEAQEIIAPNKLGEDLALSSLRGKVVLIDFWASWCGPCRRENPSKVSAYQKYGNQGFEVYSISLDSKKDSWLEAISKDNLLWDAHVCDLKRWNSKAVNDYGIRSIPANILIDRDGKVIGRDLKGHALVNKIKEQLGL